MLSDRGGAKEHTVDTKKVPVLQNGTDRSFWLMDNERIANGNKTDRKTERTVPFLCPFRSIPFFHPVWSASPLNIARPQSDFNRERIRS